MINDLKEAIRGQFGASIDMLRNAITTCPEEIWERDPKFFYMSFHCLFFLDYFLTNPPSDFKSIFVYSLAKPGHIPEGQLDDVTPGKKYTKGEILEHLEMCRTKCGQVIDGLTPELASSRWIEEGEGGLNFNLVEMLLYNMRHVQHHAAQLNMMLRNQVNAAPAWVMRAG